ncbi:hypothetical protein L6452_44383 [Arctium lappa]|uniref:Uncharacterized protein n=1 Tax=Arctium lappa TaxID=4217 RepID=A0ACB8XG97_ARCLA|nr:hypothetical protein L6452_44383 [Arctium lappa]
MLKTRHAKYKDERSVGLGFEGSTISPPFSISHKRKKRPPKDKTENSRRSLSLSPPYDLIACVSSSQSKEAQLQIFNGVRFLIFEFNFYLIESQMAFT